MIMCAVWAYLCYGCLRKQRGLLIVAHFAHLHVTGWVRCFSNYGATTILSWGGSFGASVLRRPPMGCSVLQVSTSCLCSIT